MKLSILVAFILAFGLSVSAANAADFEGLVGYWPLDGDVMDASGNGHDGILTSDGNPDWVDGRLDEALSFRNASIACGDFNPSERTDELTVALWVYWDGNNHFGHISNNKIYRDKITYYKG